MQLRVKNAGWDRYYLVWFDPSTRQITKACATPFKRARDAVAYGLANGLGCAFRLKRSDTTDPERVHHVPTQYE